MNPMHEGQFDIDARTVERLVAEQFPRWGALPVTPVESHGTVNALFRLGDEAVLRFDLFPNDDRAFVDALHGVQERVARLAELVPLELPTPLGIGAPGEGYPGYWPIYRWIDGEIVDVANVGDLDMLALDLATFVRCLQGMDVEERRWNGRSRGGPLSVRDAEVRRCIAESADLIDAVRIERMWDGCVAAPRGSAPDVWIHADLMPGNMIVRDGRLAGIIDLEGLCVADPAVDLMPAWNLLPTDARGTFRRALEIDESTWLRGMGWALCQAVVALPYYVETNQVMAGTALHTLSALLED